jgi:hypothetical protein
MGDYQPAIAKPYRVRERGSSFATIRAASPNFSTTA